MYTLQTNIQTKNTSTDTQKPPQTNTKLPQRDIELPLLLFLFLQVTNKTSLKLQENYLSLRLLMKLLQVLQVFVGTVSAASLLGIYVINPFISITLCCGFNPAQP